MILRGSIALINIDKLKEIINRRGKLRPYDEHRSGQYWNEIKQLLNRDMNHTMDFLHQCNDTELYFLSEMIDELSYEFQSKEFINFLKRLSKKHPEAEFNVDLEFAESMLMDA